MQPAPGAKESWALDLNETIFLLLFFPFFFSVSQLSVEGFSASLFDKR
jgi:hypothetical protein